MISERTISERTISIVNQPRVFRSEVAVACPFLPAILASPLPTARVLPARVPDGVHRKWAKSAKPSPASGLRNLRWAGGRIALAASGGPIVGAAGSHSGFAIFSEWAFFGLFPTFQTIQGSFGDNLAKKRESSYSATPALADQKKSKTSFRLSELPMTMDSSLKVKAGAIRARNVLTRAERVARLRELDRFDEEASVVGMPKVRVVKVSLKKKKKVKKAEDEK